MHQVLRTLIQCPENLLMLPVFSVVFHIRVYFTADPDDLLKIPEDEFYKIRAGIAVCAVFGSAGDNPTVYAAELEPDAEYRVSTDTEECGVFTGKDLMNGVPCGTLRKGEAFTKKDDSVVFVFEKIFTDKV